MSAPVTAASPSSQFVKSLALPARLVLGGILLYAGFTKLNDGWRFAEAIANYRILPAQGNQLLALTLPWLEVVLALLLVLGLWLRAAAGLATLLFLGFSIAVIAALARQLDISCGCFGTGEAAKLGAQTLALDVFCLVCGSIILLSRPVED